MDYLCNNLLINSHKFILLMGFTKYQVDKNCLFTHKLSNPLKLLPTGLNYVISLLMLQNRRNIYATFAGLTALYSERMSNNMLFLHTIVYLRWAPEPPK